MYWPRLHMPPGLGGAFWLAFLLVCLVELTLHNESVIHKYRAVFSNTTETIDVRSYVQYWFGAVSCLPCSNRESSKA